MSGSVGIDWQVIRHIGQIKYFIDIIGSQSRRDKGPVYFGHFDDLIGSIGDRIRHSLNDGCITASGCAENHKCAD